MGCPLTYELWITWCDFQYSIYFFSVRPSPKQCYGKGSGLWHSVVDRLWNSKIDMHSVNVAPPPPPPPPPHCAHLVGVLLFEALKVMGHVCQKFAI
jgi:hypothetical protein